MEGRVIKRHVWEKGVYLSKVLYLNGCVVVSRTSVLGCDGNVYFASGEKLCVLSKDE